jgi:hypothetical protein
VGFFFCFLFGLLSHTCTSFSYTESNFTFCFLQEKAPYINKASQKKSEYVKTLAAYKQKQEDDDEDGAEESDKSKSEINDDEDDEDVCASSFLSYFSCFMMC